jgi:hypothetical protein
MDQSGYILRQENITLPHFHYDVPALYLADGRRYIPVIAICKMLGLRAASHIPRWRTLLFWVTARKLPLHIPRRGTCLAWFLPLEDLHFLYICFDWQFVSPERQVQLHRAVEEGSKISGLAYQEMQNRYKTRRRFLFTFLTNLAAFQTSLGYLAEKFSSRLDDESRIWLDEHIEHGYNLCEEVVVYARQVLHDQANLPIVDALLVNPGNSQVETFSMPLLPVSPWEDSEQLFRNIGQLTSWHQQLVAFLEARGLST